MLDWKKKIEVWKSRQRQLESESISKNVENEYALMHERFNNEYQDHEAHVLELGNKFKCHVDGCDTHASVPKQIATNGRHMEMGVGSGETVVYDNVKDWSQPGDLMKCNICNKWTCEEHLHEGVCQECAEKL